MDPEMEAYLSAVERAAEIDAKNNARILDNHLLASDRVIANAAALKTIDADVSALLEAARSNPT